MSSRTENSNSGNVSKLQSAGRGMLIVVSSPSGGGKGTLIRHALKIIADVGYSVSFTTRAPREDEVNGQHYFFVSVEEFRAMESAGKFLESAAVHGNLYGTSHARVQDELAEGHDIILEIDVQGAENVRRLVPDAIMVFVLPPSYEVLCERLRARGSELPFDLALRLRNAREEVEAYRQFDYVVINDDANRAGNQLATIIYAERARRERQEAAANQVLKTFAQPSEDRE